MKKLFVHNPLFRLLSPVFCGIVVYLLILLVHNNVHQLKEQFLGEELYVCIGLSYIIQEFSRVLLLFFKRLPKLNSVVLMLVLQVVLTILLCVFLVTICITVYYKNFLGFSPDSNELLMFNGIFSVISFIYVLLHVSHYYLYKINTEKLAQEFLVKQNIEDDFKEFKAEINPSLLFESFEALLVLIKQNKQKADDFIDHLATIYRYILASKDEQLVPINNEIAITQELVTLFNYLPYRSTKLIIETKESFLIVPRSLLFLVEQIVRSTIISSTVKLDIYVKEHNNTLEVSYNSYDKITQQFTAENIADIKRVYGIYSEKEIEIQEQENKRTIIFPKLTINPN